MSCRTGGGFGGSFLVDHLLKERNRKPKYGVMSNYWDMDHYHRVCAARDRKNARDKANGTMRGPRGDPPPPPPTSWDYM